MTALPVPPAAQGQRPGRPAGLRELRAFVERVQLRVQHYLAPRTDSEEQADHLRHVADRARWLYYSELQRANPGVSVRITEHEDALIQACVFSHDIGKWLPRDELRALIPADPERLAPVFAELKFSDHQAGLFRLGVRRRLELAQDGYTPEYDSAHHLVSAFLLVTDPGLDFHRLAQPDQVRLITMIVGHQFGSYFKESLFALSVGGRSEVTTGMLMDVSRPDRLVGDLLACCFHDADISDLLFIGSLERRPNREDVFHIGGLIKILMINLTNRIYGVPSAPADLAGCIHSCQATVASACKEFLTATAREHGGRWRREARRFLDGLQDKAAYDKVNGVLVDDERPAADRLTAARTLTLLHAREYLNRLTQTDPKGPGRT
jgi:hypothetical protein